MFKKRHYSIEDKLDITGRLRLEINAIPGLEVTAEAGVKKNDSRTELNTDLEIRVLADNKLTDLPTTIEEAKTVYKNLAKKMVETGYEGRPYEFTLMPIRIVNQMLNRKGGVMNLIKSISEDIIKDLLKIFQEMDEARDKAESFKSSQMFPHFRRKLERFLHYLSQYKIYFQGQVKDLLPKVRMGSEEEGQLLDIRNTHNGRVFSTFRLKQWLKRRELEKTMLTHIKESLSTANYSINPVDHMIKQLSDGQQPVLSLTLYIPEITDEYLEHLHRFLQDEDDCEEIDYSASDNWQTNDATIRAMSNDINKFQRFCAHNPELSCIYGVLGDPNSNIPTTRISSHDTPQFERVDGTFYVPYPPIDLIEMDIADDNDNSNDSNDDDDNDVTRVTWTLPINSENVTHIEVKITEVGRYPSQDKFNSWTYLAAKDEPYFDIQTPHPTTPFKFKVRSITRIGNSSYSDEVFHDGSRLRLPGADLNACSSTIEASGRLHVSIIRLCASQIH